VNLVPARYRSVSLASVPGPLDEAGLRSHLVGRPSYRQTRYIVARSAGASALVEVSRQSAGPLFSAITAITLLAGPDETAFVEAPDTDTAIPSRLASVAARQAPGARCVIVRGRYGHVSFILDPAPIRIRVVEVVPPWPAKLLDQAQRLLDVAEEMPPVELVPELTDLRALAGTRPAGHYLFPCRAGQATAGGGVSYLDEVPPDADWTLVGCARSRAIHEWLYGRAAPAVDMCPRNLARKIMPHGGQLEPGPVLTSPVLTKCCLLDQDLVVDGQTVVVPWGASLAEVRDALSRAAAMALVPAGDQERP
jgi:hypothetical protein